MTLTPFPDSPDDSRPTLVATSGGHATLSPMAPLTAVTIVPVEAHHHEALATLILETYRVTDPGVLADDYDRELADVAGRAAVVPVLVALADGRLLGGVTYVPGPGTPLSDFDDAEAASIRHLAVAAAAQGRGVGRALVDTCLARARAEGRRRVLLHTTPAMTVAQSLYRQLGFERDPALDRWWGDVHGIAYRLELDPRSGGGEPSVRP
jgi:ribosomal protein S18 acetylase RimI-like enzyme